jgi:hypothetical protein
LNVLGLASEQYTKVFSANAAEFTHSKTIRLKNLITGSP